MWSEKQPRLESYHWAGREEYQYLLCAKKHSSETCFNIYCLHYVQMIECLIKFHPVFRVWQLLYHIVWHDFNVFMENGIYLGYHGWRDLQLICKVHCITLLRGSLSKLWRNWNLFAPKLFFLVFQECHQEHWYFDPLIGADRLKSSHFGWMVHA